MKRREFITLLGGAAAAWPLAARAQQSERMRRIGVLIPFSETDSETQALLAAFKQRFQELGWTEGRNVTYGGLIVAPAPPTFDNRTQIVAMAERLRLPAVYSYRFFVTSGGLIAYGIDGKELWRAAASYIDRILRGEKPGDLPVQLPTKYHLVINLKAAKALDLQIPDKLLAVADEVIE
jgi:hypothetical protein